MSNVKIEDFILMALNDKRRKELSYLCQPMSVLFDEYLQYLVEGGLNDIEKELLINLERKRWDKYQDDDIIASMLYKSEADYEKKITSKNYYNANGLCIIRCLQDLYNQERYNILKRAPDIIRNTYCELLRRILLESEQLVNLYQNKMKNNYKYEATARISVHTMSLHNLLRQSIYGSYSLDSFSDYEPANAIAVIRQMIELRMRKAIGIMGYVDDKGNQQPFNMSKLFEVIKKYKNIKYPVKIENIERIYKWSNCYIHSGRIDWCWIPIFIEKYLRDFSFGICKNTNWSYDNAFVIPKDTLYDIHSKIAALEPALKLFTCQAECEVR